MIPADLPPDTFAVGTFATITRGVAPTLVRVIGGRVESYDSGPAEWRDWQRRGWYHVQSYILWSDGKLRETTAFKELL